MSTFLNPDSLSLWDIVQFLNRDLFYSWVAISILEITYLNPVEVFQRKIHMVKYFNRSWLCCEFVVQFGPAILASCVHVFVQVITILNYARLSLNDVSVGEVSHGKLYLKMLFVSCFSYDHKAQARAKN